MRVAGVGCVDWTYVYLADGCVPVPVHGHYSYEAQHTYLRGDGEWWVTFVHCGPAAPMPKPMHRVNVMSIDGPLCTCGEYGCGALVIDERGHSSRFSENADIRTPPQLCPLSPRAENAEIPRDASR